MFLEKHEFVEVGERVYPFNNNFRDYVAANKILSSDEILPEDKIDFILQLMFPEPIPYEDQTSAIIALFNLYNKSGSRSNAKPVFDIEQDEDYIYAGFRQAYNVDLNSAKLTIEEFLAMLKSLPEGTKFAEIVRIRSMKVPKPTKYNAEERQAIMEAKRSVALKSQNADNGLRQFGQMIRGWAQNVR